jgi:type II secretory pathway component GspD/PulD (secretin)
VVVFATVEPGQDANQLTIHSRVLEFPDATGQKLGLDQYNIDGQTSPKANKLTAEQYAAISTASQNSDDVEVLAAPSVGTASGRQAEIQIVDAHQTASGEKYSTGPVIDFIPTISADGKSVQLVMVAQLNFSTGLPSNH